MRIGITGNIGSGKSFVGTCFAELGAVVIDAGKEVHRLYGADMPLTRAIAREFGDVLASDGSIDRKALGDIVFSDGEKLMKLNSIVHPEVRKVVERSMHEADGGITVVEAALMVESGWAQMFDVLILVVCPEKEREERLLRKGVSAERIMQVMDLQLPSYQKTSLAHFIVDNGGDEENTREQVKTIWEEIHMPSTREASIQ